MKKLNYLITILYVISYARTYSHSTVILKWKFEINQDKYIIKHACIVLEKLCVENERY